MAYKPPEVLDGVLGAWYFWCMVNDLGTEMDTCAGSASRLDPTPEFVAAWANA
ncbi:MAG TPA: hypothetical protein VJQ25_12130 [Nitrospira sp.]|nr:hypothetical protein [Nitrospira sp.]